MRVGERRGLVTFIFSLTNIIASATNDSYPYHYSLPTTTKAQCGNHDNKNCFVIAMLFITVAANGPHLIARSSIVLPAICKNTTSYDSEVPRLFYGLLRVFGPYAGVYYCNNPGFRQLEIQGSSL